ncbi:MAG: hypothetical protein ABF289_18880 [Clostridiales bacterium]
MRKLSKRNNKKNETVVMNADCGAYTVYCGCESPYFTAFGWSAHYARGNELLQRKAK